MIKPIGYNKNTTRSTDMKYFIIATLLWFWLGWLACYVTRFPDESL